MERAWNEISGEAYDGEKTGKPERPYIHDYTKTLVMKLFVSEPSNIPEETKVSLNLEQIFDLIKEIDQVTRQIPKIVYLVGWQYNGHDDKYPAFFKVNKALKRDCDKDAAESLIWLMDEAFAYNTTVSLHINMTDAYQDSPLWETYTENDLISKKENGELMDIGEWGYYVKKTAYQVNYTKEWESGYAKKRIDKLLAYLPIERAGTIHCDAFFARASFGTSLESEKGAKRKICRYFRDCGIDVTTEFLHGTNPGDEQESYTDGNDSGVIGIIPFIWHFNQSAEDYMRRPARLVTGAGINQDIKYGDDERIAFLFGKSMRGEDVFLHPTKRYGLNPNWEGDFKRQFCTQTLLWAYQNQYTRKELIGEGEHCVLFYENGLITDWKNKVISHNEVILRDANDVFVPMIWKENQEIIAYSLSGYQDKIWKLPESFSGIKRVKIGEVSKIGVIREKEYSVVGNTIEMSLKPEQMVVICPVVNQQATDCMIENI